MNAKKYVADVVGTDVALVRGVEDPDALVARCARGDTTDMFVADEPLSVVLADTQYDERHVEAVEENDLFPARRGQVVPAGKVETDVAIDSDGPTADPLILRAKVLALLERLLRRGHWGPFEHANATVGLENVSIQTERQLTRHRHITFDVQSLRYVDVSDTHSVTVPKALQDSSHATRHGAVDMDDADRVRAKCTYRDAVQSDGEAYEELLDLGVPQEDARTVLGLNTQINLTMTANLRSYLHIMNIRAEAGDAQWEIRGMGQMLEDELREWAPATMYLFDEHGPFGDAP